jgi:GTP-binding protein EngB required for normal cell division
MTNFGSIEDILRQLEEKRNNSDLYIPVPEQPARTLLLIGSTRAGKSTIVNVLRDSLYQPVRLTLYSATREAESQQIGGLRIIDMPGFHDIQNQTRNSSLSNQSIIQMLKEQFRINDPVHLIAFVFNLSNGIRQQDIDAMRLVQSNFPKLAGRAILVVTHAEELHKEDKDNLIKEFFNHLDVRRYNLQKFFKEEILFFGCLRYESLNQNDYTALDSEHQNVLEMRKKFIEKCFADISLIEPEKFTNYYSLLRPHRSYFFLIAIPAIGVAVYYSVPMIRKIIFDQNQRNDGLILEKIDKLIALMKNISSDLAAIKQQVDNTETVVKCIEKQVQNLVENSQQPKGFFARLFF